MDIAGARGRWHGARDKSLPAIDLIIGECRAVGVDEIAVVVRAGSSPTP